MLLVKNLLRSESLISLMWLTRTLRWLLRFMAARLSFGSREPRLQEILLLVYSPRIRRELWMCGLSRQVVGSRRIFTEHSSGIRWIVSTRLLPLQEFTQRWLLIWISTTWLRIPRSFSGQLVLLPTRLWDLYFLKRFRLMRSLLSRFLIPGSVRI